MSDTRWRFTFALLTTGAVLFLGISSMKLKNESMKAFNEMNELQMRAELKRELKERSKHGDLGPLEQLFQDLIQEGSVDESELWEDAIEVIDEPDEINGKNEIVHFDKGVNKFQQIKRQEHL